MAIAIPVLSGDTESTVAAPWPDGFVPGTVAPFVMRYGVDWLVAVQRATQATDTWTADTPEPAEA